MSEPGHSPRPGPWARLRAAVPLPLPVASALVAVVVVAAVVGGVLATRTAPASSRSPHLSTTPTTTPSTAPPATAAPPTTVPLTTTPSTTLPPTTASPTTSTTAVAALPHVYSNGCPGEYPGTFEPTEIPLSCADYNATISGITWSSWTPQIAHGNGTLNVNDCNPDCAGGTFHHSPTTVTLSNPAPSRTQGLIFAIVTFVSSNGSSQSQDIGPDRCATDQYVHYC